jgi:ubiquinone/menaquinone biosynthesis C-methylase UbiE
MRTLLDQIQLYWNKRAPSYSEGLFTPDSIDRWQTFLKKNLPSDSFKKVLDVGTGPGFFAIVLSMACYDVTAVDYSLGMLDKAKENASQYPVSVNFMQMDAQDLSFPDCCFDAIVTRNVTWNLENPQKAYSEWLRVLRPGGILLNFDSSWYEYLYDNAMAKKYEEDRIRTKEAGLIDGSMSYSDSPVMEDISRNLIFSHFHRPQADINMLELLDKTSVEVNETVWRELWDQEEQVMYASTPMFMIKVIK